MKTPLVIVGLLATFVATMGWSRLHAEGPKSEDLPKAATRRVDFEKDIRPVLAGHCTKCHGQEAQKSGYRLDRRDDAFRGGDSGEPAIVPGKGAESPMVHLVAGNDPAGVMPPKGPRLDPEQVGLIRAWIDQGAEWPVGASASRETSTSATPHWSLRPLALPPVPKPKEHTWIKSPVDAFIQAGLEAKGLAHAPEADRRTWIRRVSFDLIGLPPTPEEAAAFEADPAPDAYEKVVDRLLESPRYGERWARHWMDVVHFAETHGNDQDRPRPNAWPYRDYLIRSFNDDKPYARFIQEQLAGDVLYPGDSQAVVALGFIAAGPWDESSQRDIRDDTVDKKVAQYLDRDDMVATTMSTFTSTTVHCARCHNHKFDPISQEEYYGLQAVFAGVDRAERPYVVDPKAEAIRQALQERKAALMTRLQPALDRHLGREVLAAIAEGQKTWEASSAAVSNDWIVLEPSSVTSSGGATPTKLPDSSIRFDGAEPDVDTYTIVGQTALHRISAVRVEVLTDDALPQKGPGRSPNGNFHLTEFRLKAAPGVDPSKATPVALKQAWSDFDQEGWTIAHAIDGQTPTAWGIFPEVGKPHQAIFELAAPVGFDGGTALTFVLEQKHGRTHLIGRVRVSVTTSPRPTLARPLPARIAERLAIPPDRRSLEDRSALAAYYLTISPEVQAEIDRTTRALSTLPAAPMVYAGAHDFKPEMSFKPANAPRPVFILRRGDLNNPLKPAVPGALACVSGLPSRFSLESSDDEGARRAALARWVSDPRNMLTWRSIVNRVWHYHFGRGLADSPNDLGRMGAEPTHPELLDWLAVTFRDGGGSLKALHRLILTSSTYRQSCRHDPVAARLDADNLMLWRMNRSRLDAESVRDAVLHVSGKLDLTMGGPSVKQFIQSQGVHVTPVVDYLNFDVDSPGSYRRSVYRFLFRTLPDPFMDSMDCPDSSQLSPKRNASVTALQALAMLNDRFVVRQSEHFAARLARPGQGLRDQVQAAYLLALGRPPTPDEAAAVAAYAAEHGMANACRILLNSNEFMFIN